MGHRETGDPKAPDRNPVARPLVVDRHHGVAADRDAAGGNRQVFDRIGAAAALPFIVGPVAEEVAQEGDGLAVLGLVLEDEVPDPAVAAERVVVEALEDAGAYVLGVVDDLVLGRQAGAALAFRQAVHIEGGTEFGVGQRLAGEAADQPAGLGVGDVAEMPAGRAEFGVRLAPEIVLGQVLEQRDGAGAAGRVVGAQARVGLRRPGRRR